MNREKTIRILFRKKQVIGINLWIKSIYIKVVEKLFKSYELEQLVYYYLLLVKYPSLFNRSS